MWINADVITVNKFCMHMNVKSRSAFISFTLGLALWGVMGSGPQKSAQTPGRQDTIKKKMYLSELGTFEEGRLFSKLRGKHCVETNHCGCLMVLESLIILAREEL